MYCDRVVIWFLCCAWVLRACEDAPKPAPEVFAVASSFNANNEMPARARKRPIKTRRLKNAEREVDFFFMWKIYVDELWVPGGFSGNATRLSRHVVDSRCTLQVSDSGRDRPVTVVFGIGRSRELAGALRVLR